MRSSSHIIHNNRVVVNVCVVLAGGDTGSHTGPARGAEFVVRLVSGWASRGPESLLQPELPAGPFAERNSSEAVGMVGAVGLPMCF